MTRSYSSCKFSDWLLIASRSASAFLSFCCASFKSLRNFFSASLSFPSSYLGIWIDFIFSILVESINLFDQILCGFSGSFGLFHCCFGGQFQISTTGKKSNNPTNNPAKLKYHFNYQILIYNAKRRENPLM